MNLILVILFCFLNCINSFNNNILIKASQALRLSILIYKYDDTSKFSSITEYLKQKSYNDPLLDSISLYSPRGKVIKYISNNNTDLQVAITKNFNKKKLCVVFRGTESVKDWFYNLLFSKIRLKNISIHKGFYLQLKENIDEIDQIVLNNINLKTDIVITGHSKGAALATIYGYLLSYKTKKKITIISFASPKVGNWEFKNRFDNKSNLIHYRIANEKDLVCVIPIINYYHVGKVFKIKSNKYKLLNIKDHDIYEYYNNLMKLIDNKN